MLSCFGVLHLSGFAYRVPGMFLLLSSFIPLGCERASIPSSADHVPVSATPPKQDVRTLSPAAVLVAIPTATSTPSGKRRPLTKEELPSPDGESPIPGLTRWEVLNCKGMSDQGHFVVVEGDGPPREFREGGRRLLMPGRFRYCGPSAQAADRGAGRPFALRACASRYETDRSCINIEGRLGEYLNAEGERYQLAVSGLTAQAKGDALDGSLVALARRGEKKLQLRVRFHAGTHIAALPAGDSPFFAKPE